jgi:hypothetical protein
MTKKLTTAQRKVVERLLEGDEIVYCHAFDQSARWDKKYGAVNLNTLWVLRDRGLLIGRKESWHSIIYKVNRAKAEEVMKDE